MAHSAQGYISKLKSEIQDNLVSTIFEEDFLPTDKLHSIFTISAISDAVTELHCGPEHRINLADTIYHEGRRVFAMLIYSGWQDYIIGFRKHGALDGRLPLSEEDAVAITDHDIGRRLVREQWMFFPYTFPRRMWEHDCQVGRKMIIPIISAEQVGSGAFSTVERIGISPSQQNFVDDGTEIVQAVRKRLNIKGDTKEFEKEVKCLRLLNQLRHPNIIPLWGCYTYRGEQNFIFPYLDMDLGRFLLAKARHQDFQWDFTFYSALAGLASALSNTHRLLLNQADHGVDFDAIGYHHDLRPPNVLVRADTFVLADFGLGTLKRAEELSHTPYKSISGDYIAPECTDMQEIPQTVNRAIDVWAFGCLMAEVIAYMLNGAAGVEEFRKKRLTPGRFPQWKDASFYQPDGSVKREVIGWMESLRRENLDQYLVPQLIDVSLNALQPNPQIRPKINDIYRRLATLSMQKHFQSVRGLFRELQGSEPGSTPLVQRVESLQFAQKRFEIWGFVLNLSEDHASNGASEILDSCVGTMKSLLDALAEESQKQLSGDTSDRISSPRLIVRKVEKLWSALPDDMLQFAKSQWDELLHNMELNQQISSPRHVNTDVPIAQSTSPTDTLCLEFKEAARLFKQDLPPSIPLSEISRITTISDVYDITDKIQADQHRSGGLRNLSKIQPYLRRLEDYIAVTDEIIHGDCEILASLLGPIAFLLQLAATLDDAFDSLISAIAEIGQYLPDFQDSIPILNRNMETREITVLFYKDIMNLYRELLQPFTHKHWMHVFNRLWPKHFANVQEVGRHLGRLTRLMRTGIHIEHIQEEYEFRKHAMIAFKAQTAEFRRQEYHRIMTSFDAYTYDKILYRLNLIRCQGTGSWLFQSQIFLDWMGDSREEARRILWLKGIPGAGKTVLSSAIVNHLRCVNGTKTGFAFLTYQEARTSALSAIHSLIFQLIGNDEDLMAVACESMCDSLKSNLTTAGDLLTSLIRCAGPMYIILDGVDEISGIERFQLVTELLRLSKTDATLRIIFSARPEADLVRLLDGTAVVINVHEQNERNIQNYIDQRAEHIFHARNVFPTARSVIIQLLKPLAHRAKGMFLYVRLIMDIVATSQDLSEVERELAVLPENLDAAYHRIIMRLGEHKDRRRAERARTLLGWIACTPVSMTVEEAQQALLVRPNDRHQVFSIVAKLDVVEILGPIVEIVDTYIRFVHFTAQEYITSPHLGAQIINTTQATMDLARRCIDYLCQRHHDTDLTQDEIFKNVCTGQYVLHAFSIRMWLELVTHYLQAIKVTDLSNELVESIRMLWRVRQKEDISISAEYRKDEGRDGENAFEIYKTQQPQMHQILCTISRFRRSSFLFAGNTSQECHKNRDDPMSVSDTSQRIRRAFNDALCKSVTPQVGFTPPCHQNCADILQYYGLRPFKCRFLLCRFWQHGFEQCSIRDRHERSHDIPLKCHVSGCEFEAIGFLTEKMRKDHMNEAHQHNSSDQHRGGQNLPKNGIETILVDLVKGDEIDASQKALSAFPTLFDSNKTLRPRLIKIAAFQASSSMLVLLQGDEYRYDQNDRWTEYVTESIKGRNTSTLSHFLATCSRFQKYLNGPPCGMDDFPYESLVSADWYDGTKVCSKWLRNELHRKLRGPNDQVIDKSIFGGKRTIQKAGKCYNGNRQLLCIWEESGIASFSKEIWASRTLKYVAEVNCSLELVEYLLNKGASVDWRTSPTYRTPLHCAAQQTSHEAALLMEFLLLHGADPEADQQPAYYSNDITRLRRRETDIVQEVDQETSKSGKVARPGARICEGEGAKNIHKWLGKTWEELLEQTKQHRKNRDTCRTLVAQIGERG
ncbi:hypothetical protein GGR51DRAFT_503565 [Nemania sp. FL0031]|nr:hypothetical protein GGR51DRAFT_503565 [Nemania sp. FL0031]